VARLWAPRVSPRRTHKFHVGRVSHGRRNVWDTDGFGRCAASLNFATRVRFVMIWSFQLRTATLSCQQQEPYAVVSAVLPLHRRGEYEQTDRQTDGQHRRLKPPHWDLGYQEPSVDDVDLVIFRSHWSSKWLNCGLGLGRVQQLKTTFHYSSQLQTWLQTWSTSSCGFATRFRPAFDFFVENRSRFAGSCAC